MGWNWDNDPIVKGVRAGEAWMNDPVHSSDEPPSYAAVAGNAAAKAVAGLPDSFIHAATPRFLRSDATEDPVKRGMEAIGLIRAENEPQTPGQRILDMAVQAGVGTAMTPGPAGIVGLAKNVGVGLLSGAAAGAAKEVTGSDLAATAVGIAVPLGIHAAASLGAKANAPTLANPVKRSTLKDAQAAGYIVPPSQVKPSATTNKLEGVAGKAAVRQEAALRNQTITNDLAAQSIGLPKGTVLNETALENVRKQAGKVYEEVGKLRPPANMPWFPRYHQTDLVEQLKQARANATAAYKFYDRSADPSQLSKAEAFTNEARSIEGDLVRLARASGKPGLVKDLAKARTLIAKTYDVERALNLGDGNVSAHVIGRMLDKGKPLSGELKTIGKFAQAYPSVTREGAVIPASGVSGTDAAASAMLGTIGYGAAGGPVGLMAAGLPLLRSPARELLLSKGYQNRLLKQPPGLDQAVLRSIIAGRSIAEAQP